MGLRRIFRSPPPTPDRPSLDRDAISALFWIILTALLGIIALASLRSGDDEAKSILGNVASGAVGGLVGWLARGDTAGKPPSSLTPPTSPTSPPTGGAPMLDAETDPQPLPEDGDPDYDPDKTWDDEPDDPEASRDEDPADVEDGEAVTEAEDGEPA